MVIFKMTFRKHCIEMQHSHVRNWLHIIWATKKRERIIKPTQAKEISQFLMEKSKSENVPLLNLNIQSEHVHGLINLPADICLSDFMKRIKGASSYWINKKSLLKTKFSWQRGYGAYSVSASQLDIVRQYIINQDKHHAINTFNEEYEKWKKQ